MRITINLDNHAFATAEAYAQVRGIKLGQAVSELILRGSAPKVAMKQVNGLWVFDLPADAPKIASRKVKQLLDESPECKRPSSPRNPADCPATNGGPPAAAARAGDWARARRSDR